MLGDEKEIPRRIPGFPPDSTQHLMERRQDNTRSRDESFSSLDFSGMHLLRRLPSEYLFVARSSLWKIDDFLSLGGFMDGWISIPNVRDTTRPGLPDIIIISGTVIVRQNMELHGGLLRHRHEKPLLTGKSCSIGPRGHEITVLYTPSECLPVSKGKG